MAVKYLPISATMLRKFLENPAESLPVPESLVGFSRACREIRCYDCALLPYAIFGEQRVGCVWVRLSRVSLDPDADGALSKLSSAGYTLASFTLAVMQILAELDGGLIEEL